MSEKQESRPKIFDDLRENDLISEIDGSLATANLTLPPPIPSAPTAKIYDDSDGFWREVLAQEIRSDQIITLNEFFLFEWLPRSPGLFHTPQGKESRTRAADFTFQLDEKESRIYEASAPLDPIVFNLYGKRLMLLGGVGCIRLKPSQTDVGLLWFMCASSTLSAHEGVPVAIPESNYSQYINYITEHGVLPCTLIGRLKFMPERLTPLYRDYSGVPQIYVLVEEIRPARNPQKLTDSGPIVSVAVTFQHADSRYFNAGERLFSSAAYISFSPGTNGSLEKRLSWLEHYVSALHEGTIITDFDEQMSRFRGAVFSLSKVRNGELDDGEVRNIFNYYRIGNANMLIENQREMRANITAEHVTTGAIMGDVFKRIGPGATIINRSNLINAMNNAGKNSDAELADALEQVAELIEKSGNKEAADNFNAFTEELEKSSPRKSLLKSFWSGMLAALPTIAELTTAGGTIALLFKS